MSTEANYEIETLKARVAGKFGGRIATTNDFILLAECISEAIGQSVSDSTLKRLWGYVNYAPQPQTNTLNILSRYIGCESFRAFCKEIQSSSAFFACDKILSSDLSEGDTIRIGWGPDREVKLKYLGQTRFRVTDAGTSKLRAEDIVEATEFLKGMPMFFGKVIRGEEELPAYVAGKAAGLTEIELVY